MILADTQARERIRGELGTTLIVEAAAGTGKTTELVARIVALVRGGHTTLDRILSVTFTDLAAGEMKLRLRGELETARAGATAAEQARLTAALGTLEAASIGTIHSFCADLLRERPVEARVDPVFDVAAGEEQERLFDQAFEAWFQRIVGDPPEGVRRLLRRKVRAGGDPPRELLRGAGRDLAEHRDFDGAWRRDPFDRAAGLDRVLQKLSEAAALAGRAQRPEDWAAQSFAELSRWVDEVRRKEAVHGQRDGDGLEADLYELSRRRFWGWRGSGKWFSKDLERASALALRDHAKAELDAFLDACAADLAACLREELRPLCESYEDLKSRAGALDFLDLLLRARDLLRGDAAVRAELQQRFTHVLVDEFQDTDPLQAEILILIAADDPAEDDWRRTRPLPGKLFVVGDPKQSIYRFRRADIALYEDVKALLLATGAQLVHLTTSFRSVPAIQQAVNAGFEPRMTGGTQAAYVALDPFREPLPGQPAVIALPAPCIYGKYDKITKERIRESTPDAVAAFVDWLVRESGWRVSERGREAVPVEARHVCFLFKQMRSYGDDLTRPYVRALEARRIPHVLVGGRSYHAREEVLAMRTAAQAIEWPDDALSVFATLRGPLFALGDDSLLLWRERQKSFHPLRKWPAELSPQEAEVAEALSVLGELHLRRNRRPIADTLSRLLDRTRAHAGIAIRQAGEQALGNVLRVLELARRFEAAGASSFRAFVERLGLEAERGEAAEAPVVEEGTEGVRIMSVHKAKGLEFPVVVLCDPCAPAAPKNPSRKVDPERRVWAMPLAGCAPAELIAERDTLLQRDREEVIRVAYVAATRARDLLVVPATGDGEPEGWLEPLHPALYPADQDRRLGRAGAGLPPFGKETVLDRPPGIFAPLSVSPGLHTPRAGAHEVAWWDPRALALDREVEGGLRTNDLLIEEGNSAPTAAAHVEWQERRRRAVETGGVRSLRVETATARAIARENENGIGNGTGIGKGAGPSASASSSSGVAARTEVSVETVPGRDPLRPRGKRFGTLVHSVLSEIDLDAEPPEVAMTAAAMGRIAGAPQREVEAAARAVQAALLHPLLRRAAASDDCRREEPLVHRLEDGTLLEGVVDLAFHEAEGWTVIDFKTDASPGDQEHYAEQLRLYCAAIEQATGMPARAALLAV